MAYPCYKCQRQYADGFANGRAFPIGPVPEAQASVHTRDT